MTGPLDVSTVIGPLGKYQIILILLTVLRAFPTSWTLASIDFLAGDVEHWCAPPSDLTAEADGRPWTPDRWKREGIPPSADDGFPHQCERYKVVNGVVWTNATEQCDAWLYDPNAPSSSAVEWNLVCDRAWMRSGMQSLVFVGQFFGAFIVGSLSDKYGRRMMLRVSTAGMLTVGVLAAWSPSVYVFNFLRLFQATAVSGLQTTTAALYTEICLPKDRNLLNIGFSLGFTLPMILLPFLAMALDDWRWLQVSTGLSTLLLVPCLVFIQESPRWLLTKGRISEAKAALGRILQLNGGGGCQSVDLEKLTPSLVAKAQADNSAKTLGVADMWAHRKLRNNVILLFVFWFLENLFYFSNTFLATKVGSGRFASFALSSAAEVPGGILSIFLIRYCRRRVSMSVILVAAGLAALGIACTPTDETTLRLVLNMTCRFLLVMSTAIKWVYTFELIPTPARATGFACCFCFGRVGGMVAPFMRDLANWLAPAPYVVLAGCAAAATLILRFTPETLNQNLPDSFVESDRLGSDPVAVESQADVDDDNGCCDAAERKAMAKT